MKTVKLFTFAALLAIFGFGLTSCGGYDKGKAIEYIKTYDKDPEKLKKEDYATMIEWYEKIMEKYLDQWEKIAENEKKYIDYSLAMEEFEYDFLSDYPHFDRIITILRSADEDAMGSSNYKKFQKLEEKYDDREEKIEDKAPDPDDD